MKKNKSGAKSLAMKWNSYKGFAGMEAKGKGLSFSLSTTSPSPINKCISHMEYLTLTQNCKHLLRRFHANKPEIF